MTELEDNYDFQNWCGEYKFLRNDYPCTIELSYGSGLVYTFPSAENAFQARKTFNHDVLVKLTLCNAREAKAIGRDLQLPPVAGARSERRKCCLW